MPDDALAIRVIEPACKTMCGSWNGHDGTCDMDPFLNADESTSGKSKSGSMGYFSLNAENKTQVAKDQMLDY